MLRFTLILVKEIGYLVLSLCDTLSFSHFEVTEKLPLYKIFTYIICKQT